jgi:Copper type II ascorbate-dependent monooxygenase, N-terminal domain/Copper type II ascorbate-dependent monooxygenase, C-terminal domain
MKSTPIKAVVVMLIGAIGALSLGLAAFQPGLLETSLHNFDSSSDHYLHRVNQNISDVAWSLRPPTAGSKMRLNQPDATLTPDQAYTPISNDDYHCFVLDPKLERDTFVTATNIKPDQTGSVHHVILYKIPAEIVPEARKRNQASGGQGWTCFGGTDLGDIRSSANSWLAAWAPGGDAQQFPDGIGALLTKGSLVVMQVHYSFVGVAKPDRSSAELHYAPEGTKLTPVQAILGYAPIELSCPDGTNTPECDRQNIINENQKKYGSRGLLVPFGLLLICNKKLEDYQKPVGDASQIVTSCDREIKKPGMLYAVAGHMHLRGQDIKLELNPGTARAKTLLHIPKWDFHWQGNYWFKKPLQIEPGDQLRVTCRFDNSFAGQPVVNGVQAKPRYVTWAEGTTDEMCLSILTATQK